MAATNVLIVYYSAYGHVYDLARAVEEGAKAVANVEVRVRKVAEFAEVRQAGNAKYEEAQARQKDVPAATHNDLRWADGICWGTPTRYGNMTAQMKQFIDSTGSLWLKGELEGKAAGVFTSTGTVHGGQETTIITTMVPLLHLGMVLVGTPYGENPQILVTDGIGGSPYGPGTLAGSRNERPVQEVELTTARNLGKRVARVAERLKGMRGK